MDETLANRILRFCGMGLCAVLSLALFSARDALAETLSDPTRPAIGSEQTPAAEGVTAPQVGVGMVVTAKEGVMALMDGHILRVGSRTDSGVVVNIAPGAVFVRSADGKVARLPLYPGVSVQAVSHMPEGKGKPVEAPAKRQKQKRGKALQSTREGTQMSTRTSTQMGPQNRSTSK